MVYGFQSNSKSRLISNYAASLSSRWIDALRVDLYNSKYRDTMNVDLDDHIGDLEKVLTDIARRYKKVIYIEHSLG